MKCPFRLATPFDPTDGSWYWVTTDTYGGPGGAHGNGTDDDTAHINAVISAAYSAGKHVYFPAGTYLVSTAGYYALEAATGVNLRGAGAASSVITMAHSSSAADYVLLLSGVSNLSIRDLGFYTAAEATPYDHHELEWYDATFVRGIYGEPSCSSIEVKDCAFTNLDFAIQLSSGAGGSYSDFLFDNLTVTNCIMGLFAARLQNSLINDCDISCYWQEWGPYGNPQEAHWHCLYLCYQAQNVTINRCNFYGAGNDQIHLWDGTTAHDITFNDCLSDCTTGVGGTECLIVGDDFDGVYFNGCTFKATTDGVYNSAMHAGGTAVNVVFDGFVATGANYLMSNDGHDDAVWTWRNGTFDGTAFLNPTYDDGTNTFEETCELV